jgi:hypothetical protein
MWIPEMKQAAEGKRILRIGFYKIPIEVEIFGVSAKTVFFGAVLIGSGMAVSV